MCFGPRNDEEDDGVVAVDDVDNLPWDEDDETFEEVPSVEDDILRNWT